MALRNAYKHTLAQEIYLSTDKYSVDRDAGNIHRLYGLEELTACLLIPPIRTSMPILDNQI